MKTVGIALCLLLSAANPLFANEYVLPEFCDPAQKLPEKDWMIFGLTSVAIRRGDAAFLSQANRCLWQLWPMRDGALTKNLVQNFLFLAEASPGIFVDIATREQDKVSSLLINIRAIGFVSQDRRDRMQLLQLRKSLDIKLVAELRPTKSKEKREIASQLLAAIRTADMRTID